MSLTCYKITVNVTLRPCHRQRRNLSQQALPHSDSCTNFFCWRILVNTQMSQFMGTLIKSQSLNFVGRVVSNTVTQIINQINLILLYKNATPRCTTNTNMHKDRDDWCAVSQRINPFRFLSWNNFQIQPFTSPKPKNFALVKPTAPWSHYLSHCFIKHEMEGGKLVTLSSCK